MKAWLSTMPVSGDQSAAVQVSAGSASRAAAPVSISSPSTPFFSPSDAICSILAVSASLVATISLPHLRCGTPWLSQKA